MVLRYEDNGDSVNHVVVLTRKADKGSIEGYGSPDEFLGRISSLLGEQVFSGAQAWAFVLPGLVLFRGCCPRLWRL